MDIAKSKNHIIQYVIYTYGLFILLLLALGAIATILLHGTPFVMKWLTAITAWTPTYVFLLMFKKLYPGKTVKSFYKNAFKEKVNVRLLATIFIIQIIIFASSVFIVSARNNVSFISMLDFSFYTLMSALFFTLIQGATGEESGWRGYLLPAINKKYGIARSSLIVSIIWSFWHAPIWFLETGYSGAVLFRYIIVFVICITSLGFVMGVCYQRCKNLFVPIFIHFTFNFLGEMFKGSRMDLVTWYAVFYFVTATGFFLWNKNSYVFLKTRQMDDKNINLQYKKININII